MVGVVLANLRTNMALIDLDINYLSSLVSQTSSITLTLCVGLFLLLLFLWYNRSGKNIPPGPWGLPIVGYLPFVSNKTAYLDFFELHKKYGDVYSFRIPGNNLIVFNSYDTVRDAFVKQGEGFIGLPRDFTLLKWLAKFRGLGGQDGVVWKEQRRFVLRTLKDFGFGRMMLEGDIHDATNVILKAIQDNANRPYDIRPIVTNAAGNVVNKMLFNKKFEMNDPVFQAIRQGAEGILGNDTLPGMEALRPLVLFGKYIPIEYLPKFQKISQLRDKLYDTIESIIKEHEDNFDPNNLKDYIDVYLDKVRNIPEDSEEAILYDRSNLAPVLVAMVFGGMDTSSETIAWMIKLLCLNQDVQTRMHEEIDEVIGRERLPCYADNAKTPYINAVINEVHRFITLLPLSLYFRNDEEAIIGGYRIPKNSLLLANIYSVHRDPRQWANPDKFDPGHFIDAEGNLKKEGSMPFFIGKRGCPGEILAKMTLYIMTAALIQRFVFRLADGESESLEIVDGMTRVLPAYNVIAQPRY